MKRILLTGGTGFVGANLVRRLLHDGHEVHLFGGSGAGDWRLADIAEHVARHAGHVGDEQAVRSAVRTVRPDWIFHLAAHGAYSWQEDARTIVDTNLVGTMQLLEACLQQGFEAFVHAGSSSEYGYQAQAPDERTLLAPNSTYAVTKAAATLYCQFRARAMNAHVATLRLYSVYGPYEDPGRLISTLLRHVLRGIWPPLVSPETARDFIHTDDVNAAFLRVAEGADKVSPGAIYNLGTGTQTTLRDLVTVSRELFEVEQEPVWNSMPGRRWDTSVWVADSSQLRHDLGWEPQHDLRSGLLQTAEWFRQPEVVRQYERLLEGRQRRVA